MGWTSILLATALVQAPSQSSAQARSDDLADRWREAKRSELAVERARIDAQIAALANATPDTLAAAATRRPAPSIAAPAPPPPAAARPSLPAGGQDAAETADGNVADGPAPRAPTTNGVVEPKSSLKDGRGSFGGLDLGVGLSFTLDLDKLDRVSDASIVDGRVRVTDQNNGRARIMLESHYFFVPCWKLFRENPCEVDAYGIESAVQGQERWGFGPFIAVQPGSGEIIDAIGMGIMAGARRDGSRQSFNFGIGIVVDPNTRVLGDGFIENQPPPGTETEVRYRETLQTGVLFLTSFSF